MNKFLTYLVNLFRLFPSEPKEVVNVNGFADRIKDPDVFLLDVRPDADFQQEHIEGATNIPAKEDNFLKKVKTTLPTDKTIAVYCKSGQCSTIAAELLVQKRYKVMELDGGFNAWKNAEMPTVLSAVTPEA